ncbi:hypothetical protein OI70_19115 [Dickeya fangzhongdai]|uniref:electron transfer flavoprotein subunit beta/FixA family protein n=1 Tax=Dickeya fangzhongdai TaxID=1778540 RepID=UPI000573650C|nr:electron transfer flavoprotein subunit beta/FixA family protein [Dickeya fangzhongdai]KHN52906.1 hypothetical protein OI70_19115 [Dickeya fangzhongdai]
MKILVAVKRVPDQDIPVRLSEDGNSIDPHHRQMTINPFDEIAIEEGIRLKERGIADEVIVVSCGPAECNKTLRTALAFGADRAFLVKTDEELQSLATAKLLAALARRESIDLILCGKQATDTDNAETAVMAAGLLGWGQATIVSALHIEKSGVTATSEIDGGRERLVLSLPAVISVDLRLNSPRHLGLHECVQANKKTIDIFTPEELQVDIRPRLRMLHLEALPPRNSPIRVTDINELVTRLRDEAGVL